MNPKKIPEAQFWVSVATLALGLLAVLLAWFTLRAQLQGLEISLQELDRAVDSRAEDVKQTVLANQFVVTYPAEDESVGLTSAVRGRSPYSGMHHYIIITPLETGVDYVQDSPVTIYTGGSWSGRAGFGDAAVGVGQQFLVRGMATTSTLSPGPLTEVPENAKFSEAITVTRTE